MESAWGQNVFSSMEECHLWGLPAASEMAYKKNIETVWLEVFGKAKGFNIDENNKPYRTKEKKLRKVQGGPYTR